MPAAGERRGHAGDVVVIAGELDRRRAEALCVEIRALARQCGVAVARLDVMSGTAPAPGGAGETPDAS
jgi:hypothetical protein